MAAVELPQPFGPGLHYRPTNKAQLQPTTPETKFKKKKENLKTKSKAKTQQQQRLTQFLYQLLFKFFLFIYGSLKMKVSFSRFLFCQNKDKVIIFLGCSFSSMFRSLGAVSLSFEVVLNVFHA